MNSELLATLNYIEQERGISKDQLIEAIEKALLTASRKSIHPASDLSIKVDRKTGDIRAWAKLKVVEAFANNDEITLKEVAKKDPSAQIGDIIDWEVTPRDFGRIAAQTALQAIRQQIRKAEKETVMVEFKDQVGEIINGTVRRIDRGNVIVEFNKAEGVLGAKDKIPTEQYNPGDRINALLTNVDIEAAGPSLILTRANATFLRKLFEREVTEIHDGVVEIVGVARDAGIRSKIAVRSNDPRVDPVGACVGMRGMRVKNITNELNGERVDIIHYTDDLIDYVHKVFHPAKLLRVDVDEDRKQLTVYVDQENSRLAFGKEARNVRLAQKLLQWRISLVIEDPNAIFEARKAEAVQALADELSISEDSAAILVNKGYLNVDGLRADAENEDIFSGLSDAEIQSIRAALAAE